MKAITLKYEYFSLESYIVKNEKSFLHGVMNSTLRGNFHSYNDTRFRSSQVVDSIFNYVKNTEEEHEEYIIESINKQNERKYIIPVAVASNPCEWSDMDNFGKVDPNKKSIFEFIHPEFLKDLQNEKALLLIDQSIEGYHQLWLWDWFHKKCNTFNIDPKTIIYMTGDQACSEKYDQWCVENKISSKLKVIPSISLSHYIRITYDRSNLNINFDELLEHKKNNSSTLYLYDCFNLRPRAQRILFFLHLLSSDLLKYGNVSMSDRKEWEGYIDLRPGTDLFFKSYNLPIDIVSKLNDMETVSIKTYNNLAAIPDYYKFYERILDQAYRNSWLSVVTESSYFYNEHSIFISEKTFKPIACMQPFIILGSKGTLKYLRKLGYKTFHPFIDESYDELDDKERFIAIIEAIKKVQAIEDKVSWYRSMREIVEHNHNLFMQISKTKSTEHKELIKYYFEYSGEASV